MLRFISFTAILLSLCAFAAAQPTLSESGEMMRIDLAGSSVTANGSDWDLTIRMEADNGTEPTLTFRRWWYCRIDNLNSGTGETLNIDLTNTGYTDTFYPVWSLDGGTTFSRVPLSSGPSVSGSGPWTLSFSFDTPIGVSSIHLAKYFPHTVTDKDAYLASISSNPLVNITVTGTSAQGRDIERVDISNSAVPDTNKHRIWVHARVHPAETTSAWVVEGLIDFLLSSDATAEGLRDNCIFNIIPMLNPDGVYAGNYRTTTNGTNLEMKWASPWDSTEPEILAIRDDILDFMGTTSEPPGTAGDNPIELLLNLHSSHGNSYGYLFNHEATWTEPGDNGVNQTVHDLEGDFIAAFETRSAYVDLGHTQVSTLGGSERPYIEGMMFDRWSRFSEWTGSPNFAAPIVALTFEGTYYYGPDTVTWNTPDDFRQVGLEMGRTIADFFSISPTAVEDWDMFE